MLTVSNSNERTCENKLIGLRCQHFKTRTTAHMKTRFRESAPENMWHQLAGSLLWGQIGENQRVPSVRCNTNKLRGG